MNSHERKWNAWNGGMHGDGGMHGMHGDGGMHGMHGGGGTPSHVVPHRAMSALSEVASMHSKVVGAIVTLFIITLV